MKKTGIVLMIISVIALIILLYMQLTWWNDGSRRANFIIEWSWFFLVPLALPLIGKSITIHLTMLKTRIWVIIHLSVTLIWIFAQVFVYSFIERTMDLSLCINRNYSTTTITVQTVSTNRHTQTITTGRNTFRLETKDFHTVTRSETYQITYLPNSKYVINIIDENGKSLLKKR